MYGGIGPKRDSGKSPTWRKQVGEQAAKGGGNIYSPKGTGSAALAQQARMAKNKAGTSPGASKPRPGSSLDKDIKGIEAKRRDVNEHLGQSRYAKDAKKTAQTSPNYKLAAMKNKLAKAKAETTMKNRVSNMRPSTGK